MYFCSLHVFLWLKKIPQKWIQSRKYVQGNREVNTYEIKLVGKTHYGAEDIVTAWLNSSCHLPFCPLSNCFLLNSTVEWIIWESNIKSSWKKNQRTLHRVPIEVKHVNEPADWLELVNQQFSKFDNFWQIWFMLWGWGRDVFMSLVFIWPKLFLRDAQLWCTQNGQNENKCLCGQACPSG